MTGFAADRGVATVALVVENHDEAIRMPKNSASCLSMSILAAASAGSW